MKVIKNLTLIAALMLASCMTGNNEGANKDELDGGNFKITTESMDKMYVTGVLNMTVNKGYDVVYVVEDAKVSPSAALTPAKPQAQDIFNNGTRAYSNDNGEVNLAISDANPASTLYFILAKGDAYLDTVYDVAIAHATPVVVDGLKIRLSKYSVYADGVDAAYVYVVYKDKDANCRLLNEGEARFYNTDGEDLNIPDMKLTSTEVGQLSFWASYATLNTKNDPVIVNFIKPQEEGGSLIPEDPQPSNLSFVHRALLIDYTGVGCGYCPYMITAFKDVLAEEDFIDKAYIAACHTYGNDPFKPSQNIANAFNFSISGYPTLTVDMRWKIENSSVNVNKNQIRSKLRLSMAEEAQAGIAVAMRVNERQVKAEVEVKAAVENKFRIGAFLLEDGLRRTQSNYDNLSAYDYNIHDDVIRYADSQYSASDFTGHDIGTLTKGSTATYTFNLTVDEKWNIENCHVLFFVTGLSGSKYYVKNAINLPIKDQDVAYEYK